MKTINRVKLKAFIKRIFPFVKYFRYIYNKKSEVLGKFDLTQDINPTRNPKMKVEIVDDSNRDSLRVLKKNNYDDQWYNEWMSAYYKQNHDGFIASIQGNIIGYMWWWTENSSANPPTELSFYNIKLEIGEVFSTDFYLAPQYRGSGNSNEFLNRIHLELKKLGFQGILGTCRSNNIPALWTYKIIGYKDIKTIITYKFFNSILFLEKAMFLKNFRFPHYIFTAHPLFLFRKIFSPKVKIKH